MEKIDKDTSNWVMEFLLRSSVPDSLIQKTLTVLPISGDDRRLKKTLLLRTLQSHVQKASLSETTLQILESLEELDHQDAIPVSDALRRAYCAVAVESTVKYLIFSPEDPSGEYISTVRRIWRGPVVPISKEGSRGGLISDEFLQWRDDIEAALLDPRVSERLVGLNTRLSAVNEVKRYLKEAWEIMGPSFLDSMATMSKAKRLRTEGVCEFASSAEPLMMCDEGLERNSAGGDKNDDDDDDNDVAATSENQRKEQLEERVDSFVDTTQKASDCDSAKRYKATQKGNIHVRRKHSALRTCHRGVKISGDKEKEPAKLGSKYDPFPSPEVNKVRESLKSSSMELQELVKDPLPDALHTSEVVRSKFATNDINLGPPIENQSEDVDVPNSDGPPIENRSGDVDAPNSNNCLHVVLYQPNDANLGKKSSVDCRNAHVPNIMERKSSATTYEWNDSIDNSPQGKHPKKRKRRWTSLEEETLRAGVKMFGEGSWTTIRNFYSNIFEFRSAVDLKDKWRNMMR